MSHAAAAAPLRYREDLRSLFVSDRTSPKQHVLLFLHQPKTGGKTLESVWPRLVGKGFRRISRMFPEAAANDIRRHGPLMMGLPMSERQAISFITGHMFFGVHEGLPRTPAYVTLLRDPTRRLLSYYNYFMSSPEAPLNEYLTKNGVSFGDFVGLGASEIRRSGVHELEYTLENGQARLLAGPDENGSWQCLLQAAVRNIEAHFAFVGATERYDESLIGIGNVLGVRGGLYYYKRNVASRGVKLSEVDNQTHRVIEERNRADIALNAAAIATVDAFTDAEGSKLKRAIRRLRLENAIYQRYWAAKELGARARDRLRTRSA